MSDVKFNLKPVIKQPRKKKSITDNCTTISNYEKETGIFLSGYKYQPNLTSKLDNLEEIHFDQALLNEIILWKINRYATFTKALLEKIESVKKFKQGEHRKGDKVLFDLLKIKGVDLAMASTILRFRNPEVYQIIDRHAYRAIYGVKYPLYPASSSYQKIDVYFDYLDMLIQISKEKRLEYKSLDRLLYEFDKQLNGKL